MVRSTNSRKHELVIFCCELCRKLKWPWSLKPTNGSFSFIQRKLVPDARNKAIHSALDCFTLHSIVVVTVSLVTFVDSRRENCPIFQFSHSLPRLSSPLTEISSCTLMNDWQIAYASGSKWSLTFTYQCRGLVFKWNVSLYQNKWNPRWPLILALWLVADICRLLQGEENKEI